MRFDVAVDRRSIRPLASTVPLAILLASNDDDGVTTDSYLTFPAPSTGDYYVVVHGNGNLFQTDPNVGGSGQGTASRGIYDLKIHVDNNLISARPIVPPESLSDGSRRRWHAERMRCCTGINGEGAIVVNGVNWRCSRERGQRRLRLVLAYDWTRPADHRRHRYSVNGIT